MDAQRQKTYRYLLYLAMLDIRQLAWMPFGFFRLLNPFKWRPKAIKVVGMKDR